MELHWGQTSVHPFPTYEHVCQTPVVIDFVPEEVGDSIPEVIFISYDVFGRAGVLRVVSGRASHPMLMTIAGRGAPDDPTDTPILLADSHPAAGDLNGDGWPEVVAAIRGGGMIAYEGDGSVLWESDEPSSSEFNPNGSIAIADLEGDGTPEIVVGRAVLDNMGELLWVGREDRGMNGQGPLSCVADLDMDGEQEVIAGRTAYRADGSVWWEATGSGQGFCAIADVYAGAVPGMDGSPEVIRMSAGYLYILAGTTGERLLRWRVPGSSDRGGAPTVADFDGDGLAEIGVAGSSRYIVYDPDAEAELWRHDIEDDSSYVTSSTVFDFNGDGTAEVIYNDEQRFMVFNGPDGELLFEEWNPSRTRTEQPVVADVDNDGNAEIIFSANAESSAAGSRIPAALRPTQRVGGLEIWGSADDAWVPAPTIWNQHTYHITNVNPDGTIPAAEEPSWVVHNTYRSNASIDFALSAPDLVIRPGAISCFDGLMSLCARISNRGEVRVAPGIEVNFYSGDPDDGGEVLCIEDSELALEPGDHTMVCCAIEDPGVGFHEIYGWVDEGGHVRECNEDNNTVFIGELACPPT